MALKAIAPSAAGANAPGAIEDEYQKLTQREHILKRPDTYVGSVEAETRKEWVMVEAAGRMEQRDLTVAPALYKIFDEIVVNAADNKQRDPTMTTIKVTIDREAGSLSVWAPFAKPPACSSIPGECLTSNSWLSEQWVCVEPWLPSFRQFPAIDAPP